MTPASYKEERPQFFTTLTPYLITEDPQEMVDVYKNIFAAEELNRTVDNAGAIRNIILKIGDTAFMIGRADGMHSTLSSFYLFADDVDALYDFAIKSNCVSIYEPYDADYGDRSAGVKDKFGNSWWISKRADTSNYGS